MTSSLSSIATEKVATSFPRKKMTATKVTKVVYNTRYRRAQNMAIVIEKGMILPVECKSMVEKKTIAPLRNKKKTSKHTTDTSSTKSAKNHGERKKSREPRILPKGYTPRAFDVICAKGAFAFKHAGNVRFRHRVLERTKAYENAKSKDIKTKIICALVDQVRNEAHEHHGGDVGGFVRFDYDSQCWVELGDEAAKEKAGQTMREHIIRENPDLLEAKCAMRRNKRKNESKSKQRTRSLLFTSIRIPVTPSSSVADDHTPARTRNKDDESSVATSRTFFSPQPVSEYSVKEDSSDLMLISLEKLPTLVHMTSSDWGLVPDEKSSTDENTTSDDHRGVDFHYWNTFGRGLAGWS
jgi:hypothetical protein